MNENILKANELIIFPDISDELITALQKTYPNEIPDKKLDEFDFGVCVGIQRVIKKLISEKGYQEKEI